MQWWIISILNLKFLGVLWSTCHRRVYMLPIKKHSSTETIVKALSALLMFSIFKIVIYSYIFIRIRNLIKYLQRILAFLLWWHSKGGWKKLPCIKDSWIFWTAAVHGDTSFYIWIYEFFKNHPRKRVFRNVSLSNLENVLQRNLRTNRARECHRSTYFENFSARRQPWWCLRGFDVCTSMPK